MKWWKGSHPITFLNLDHVWKLQTSHRQLLFSQTWSICYQDFEECNNTKNYPQLTPAAPNAALPTHLSSGIIAVLPTSWFGLAESLSRGGEKGLCRAPALQCCAYFLSHLGQYLSPERQVSKSDLLNCSHFASPLFKESDGQPTNEIY